MAQAVVLAAGNATRLGGQFKPMVEVAGKRVIDWQRPFLPGQVTIVGPVQGVATTLLGTDYFPYGQLGGPVAALNAVLPHLSDEGHLTVVFADTLWFQQTPRHGNWLGVASADGGRVWDVVDEMGRSGRFEVPAGQRRTVAVGLYGFEDTEKLKWACEEAIRLSPEPECHMYRVTNLMGMGPVRVDWVDVGDRSALAAAEEKLK